MRIKISDLKRIIKEELSNHYGHESCVACGTIYVDGEDGDKILGLCDLCAEDTNAEGLDDLEMGSDELDDEFDSGYDNEFGDVDANVMSKIVDDPDFIDENEGCEAEGAFMYEAAFSKAELEKMRKEDGLQHSFDTSHGKLNGEPGEKALTKDYEKDWAAWIEPSSIDTRNGIAVNDLDDDDMQLVTKPLASYVKNQSTTNGLDFDQSAEDEMELSFDRQDFMPQGKFSNTDGDDLDIDID